MVGKYELTVILIALTLYSVYLITILNPSGSSQSMLKREFYFWLKNNSLHSVIFHNLLKFFCANGSIRFMEEVLIVLTFLIFFPLLHFIKSYNQIVNQQCISNEVIILFRKHVYSIITTENCKVYLNSEILSLYLIRLSFGWANKIILKERKTSFFCLFCYKEDCKVSEGLGI